MRKKYINGIPNYKELTNSKSLSKGEKVKALYVAKNKYDTYLDNKLRQTKAKLRLGGAAQFLGAITFPEGILGKLGVGLSTKLVPYLGKKLSQSIISGGISGAAGGSLFGLGDALMNDKNLMKTTLKGTAGGGALGGTLGLGGAQVQKMMRNAELKNYIPKNMSKTDYYKYKKSAEDYYKDYLQGRIIKNRNIGDISLTRKGMDETFNKNPELGKFFPNLANGIRRGKYFRTDNLYKNRQDDIIKFHNINKDKLNYLIGENAKKQKRFYLMKSSTANQGLPPKAGGASVNGTNNIISNFFKIFNRPTGQKDISKTLFQYIIDNVYKKNK